MQALHSLKLNPLSVKITKWSNTLKQFVGNLPKNCLSVFDHFVGLALTGLKHIVYYSKETSTPILKRTNVLKKEFLLGYSLSCICNGVSH